MRFRDLVVLIRESFKAPEHRTVADFRSQGEAAGCCARLHSKGIRASINFPDMYQADRYYVVVCKEDYRSALAVLGVSRASAKSTISRLSTPTIAVKCPSCGKSDCVETIGSWINFVLIFITFGLVLLYFMVRRMYLGPRYKCNVCGRYFRRKLSDL